MSAEHALPFYLTRNYSRVAAHIERYCGISSQLAGKRLHVLKATAGFPPDLDVVFDLSGSVYHPVTLGLLGSLTLGGAKEKA